MLFVEGKKTIGESLIVFLSHKEWEGSCLYHFPVVNVYNWKGFPFPHLFYISMIVFLFFFFEPTLSSDKLYSNSSKIVLKCTKTFF